MDLDFLILIIGYLGIILFIHYNLKMGEYDILAPTPEEETIHSEEPTIDINQVPIEIEKIDSGLNADTDSDLIIKSSELDNIKTNLLREIEDDVKDILIEKKLRYNSFYKTEEKVVVNFDETAVDSGDIDLGGSFNDLVYQIDKNKPSKEFAKKFLNDARLFYNKLVELRQRQLSTEES